MRFQLSPLHLRCGVLCFVSHKARSTRCVACSSHAKQRVQVDTMFRHRKRSAFSCDD
ncbi:TPA: hypothetical protein N0F65_005631 [Lagenidium giganteum]|uniref:Secreted protein n=1 Tax=Lagenidium giganteum TaxID=4803 RepID=A0AAV2YTA4_9STRA|nr:TPA: hypothetical protein N0F65_005631 [Lagenidium giganteum]